MNITPLEIRQKTFEKIFRGYDKDEVTSFLNLLSQEWEKMNDEKKVLQMKLEQSEKETAKLREVEDSLFKTLKTAEDTGASMIEQANKTAELIIREAQMDADALHAETKNMSRNIIGSADSQAKSIMEDLKEDVVALIEGYETLLAQREIVLKNLKNIANETLENVNFAKEEVKRIDVTAHARLVKELNRQGSYSVASDRAYKEAKQNIVIEDGNDSVQEKGPVENMESEDAKLLKDGPEAETPQEEPPVEVEKLPEEKPKRNDSGSFFDQFD
ncbi:MAG: DivIVA domain-containing protein [Anditalea sp.]